MDGINQSLKNLRKARGLTLSQLADRVGFTKGYLSRIENAVVPPPFATVERIASALGADLTELLPDLHEDAEKNLDLVRARQREGWHDPDAVYTFRPLVNSYRGKQMSPFLFRVQKGSTELYAHDSEEFVYILKGEVTLHYDKRVHRLRAGDSFYLDARIKHGGHRLFERDQETAQVVTEMLIDLEKNGMDAVRKYSEKFDAWNPDSFELTDGQINEAITKLDPQLIEDTDFCQNNVRSFAKAQLQTMLPLEVETRPGIILGHKHIPVGSVGSYVPGGRYPMFGSAQMSIIPAKVAGVKNVYAFTPPVKGVGFYGATVNAMKKAGADRVFILGGVPAFAMMAFGMGQIPPVDVLCGAGNKFVAEAKRQLFGRCGIDLLAGPTEILVIADDSADPELVACDLLGQAEHDPNSGICLICLSEDFAAKCIAEVDRQLKTLLTADVASQSWEMNGIVYVVDDAEEAIAISDDYAPEHLELHTSQNDYYFDRLTNYGSLFIGEETTVAYGDKSIGTNHILPTSRAARYTGGLWVGKFLKTVTYQRMTELASREIGEVTDRQCAVEQMVAHGLTARMRVKRYGGE